jgi:gamma-glutamyltranspeptidase/glutathione hydrolase
MRILRQGGNAVDAGVAAGICLDVVFPDLCSFGGVAPLIVYHAATDELVSISGLGYWGRRANRDYFIDYEGGEIPPGVKRSIVPGAPDSWLTALARYGRLSFAEVVQPAIELCEGGFVVYPSLQRNLAAVAGQLRQWPSTAAVMLPSGEAPVTGTILKQPDLARTFRRLTAAEARASGRGRAAGIEAARDEFYRGEVGREIVAFVQQGGGFLDDEDFADFHSDIEVPLQVGFGDLDVFVCGPWCQGPVLAQALRILDGIDLASLDHNSAEYIDVVIAALNLAFADRERYYGDPKHVDVPMDFLLSVEYVNEQLARLPGTPASGAGRLLQDDARPAQRDTSYVCVVDQDGNAFSATPSDVIEGTPIVPGLGLVCSGRGDQSWLEAGHPSVLAPRKRPRLTPAPAMAFRDGRLFMPFGTPGGDMQQQSMLQTLLNVAVFGMDVQEAVEKPRFGTFSFPNSFWPHEHLPNRLCLEGRIPEQVAIALAERHDVVRWPDWTRTAGSVCAIVVDQAHGTLAAGADSRAEAYALGW